MEDKITKDMVSQLKRIADALEKKNSLTESDQKRRLKLEKLQEKNLKADLREKFNVQYTDNHTVTPRLEDI
jgi:hypothetical protein|tara:strand:+ start:459 stop:671 length:213 start_codon:yes stop_codon:yes gene_type:complete